MTSVPYTHGHHDSVLRSHRWRTAENSAAYLSSHLSAGLTLLDIGCGPGTITADFAALVSPGQVVGVDSSTAVIEAARRDVGEFPGLTFATGDVYALDFPDGTFDVVHAHQVLQHLGDPVAALKEMRRVCKPGGLIAARDADYAAMTWYPSSPGLSAWLEAYRTVAQNNGAQPDAGRVLRHWALEAGFTEVTSSASAWCYATEAERAWWGGLWADRVQASLAPQALSQGVCTQGDLDLISEAFRDWAGNRDAWWAVLHGEILCPA